MHKTMRLTCHGDCTYGPQCGQNQHKHHRLVDPHPRFSFMNQSGELIFHVNVLKVSAPPKINSKHLAGDHKKLGLKS